MAAAPQLSGISQVNHTLRYTDTLWVVSLQNSGKVCGGHSRIIVEGIALERHFVGQYEVAHYVGISSSAADKVQDLIGNVQGYITEIKIHQAVNYRHDYAKYHSKSWFVSPIDVLKMVATIKTMCNAIEQEMVKYRETGNITYLTHKYQVAGAHRTALLGGNAGHSCVTWAEEMLKIAKVGNGIKAIDSIKALPEAHVVTLPWSHLAKIGLLGVAALLVIKRGK